MLRVPSALVTSVLLLSSLPVALATDCPSPDVEPAPPVLLGHTTPDGYQLTWTDVANGPLGFSTIQYDVFRISTSGLSTPEQIGSVAAPQNFFDDTDVPAGAEVAYWVVARSCQDSPVASNVVSSHIDLCLYETLSWGLPPFLQVEAHTGCTVGPDCGVLVTADGQGLPIPTTWGWCHVGP